MSPTSAIIPVPGSQPKQEPDDARSPDKPGRESRPGGPTGPWTPGKKIVALVRQSIRPFSDRLDPFAALPVNLGRFQEHLVTFYLLYYPRATYGLSSRLRPHPVASNFCIAVTTPACFHVSLARAAAYRIALNKYATDTERRALEQAVMRHKGEALQLVRALSATTNPRRKDDLVASIISLGTLDRRTGSTQTASVHFAAVRRILKATGGPLAVESVLLSRVMCFFECIYGSARESYIWDPSDLMPLLAAMNDFLSAVRTFWASLSRLASASASASATASTSPSSSTSAKSSRATPIHSFGLQPDSTLRSLIQGEPPWGEPVPQGRALELIFQLTSLVTLAMVLMDHAADIRTLQRYMDGLHATIGDIGLDGQSCNNALWQIQIHDHSGAHSQRTWRAASYAWVVKHVQYNVQLELKDWLLAFLMGDPVRRVYRLDAFHFSYAN